MDSNKEGLQVPLCKQNGCRIASNGECLEDLDLDTCPHFYWQVSAKDVNDEVQKLLSTNNKNIELPSGFELSLEETVKLTNKYNCRVIMIVGESDSGKTTLSSIFHELFLKDTFGDYWFAGSETPLGFEQRCHLSRTSSGREKPGTEKTTSIKFSFLHLALKHKDRLDEKAEHLLLADVSGERYKMARDSSESMRDLGVIKSAHRILFALDGEKLADKKLAHSVTIYAQTFIRKALEEGIFNKETCIDLVITKWDILAKSKSFLFENTIELPFTKLLKDKVKDFKILKIAARPTKFTPEIELGYGLDYFLKSWLSRGSIDSNTNDNISISEKDINDLNCRQFIRYMNSQQS